jgi:hypothetical protein
MFCSDTNCRDRRQCVLPLAGAGILSIQRVSAMNKYFAMQGTLLAVNHTERNVVASWPIDHGHSEFSGLHCEYKCVHVFIYLCNAVLDIIL